MSAIAAWIMSRAAGFLATRLGLWLAVGAGAAMLVAIVTLRVFNAGRNAAMTEALNAQLQRARERLALKDRQLEAANRRPADRDGLERLLERGEF